MIILTHFQCVNTLHTPLIHKYGCMCPGESWLTVYTELGDSSDFIKILYVWFLASSEDLISNNN